MRELRKRSPNTLNNVSREKHKVRQTLSSWHAQARIDACRHPQTAETSTQKATILGSSHGRLLPSYPHLRTAVPRNGGMLLYP